VVARRAAFAVALAAGLAALPVTVAAPVPPPPIVWVQAGHESPGEPGYRAQTGAAGEAEFNRRVAAAVERRLRAAGVDARHTPGRVTPLGASGAVFVSIHYDTPGGHSTVGHAITGAGENWYHGEGTGQARSTPYPDSAPHRPATRVSATVERNSARLASILAARYGAVFTRANGARSGPVHLEPRTGNRRVMRYYGYYRTRAAARVLIEAGAAGTDTTILNRTELVARAIAGGIVDYLRSRGQLSVSPRG
jgi:hypothetical protein